METPVVSIIVLTFNQLEKATKFCIESVIKNTDLRKNELIVVDNASTDNTPGFLRKLESSPGKIRVKLNQWNRGYAGGNNDGIRMARGRYIVLLNNDTLTPAGWLGPLVNALETHPNIGLAGPVTNFAGNEQRIELRGLNRQNFEKIAAGYTSRNKGIWFETHRLGFFCVAMRAELIGEIGYLDEEFGIGMFEDDDFCLRVMKERRQSPAVLEDCFVYHMGGASFKHFSHDDYYALFRKNEKYFLKKHGFNWILSDSLLAYWAKLERDFSAFREQTGRLDPNIERALVRFEDFKHLLIQSYVAERKPMDHNKTTSPLAKKYQRQIRREIFRREFISGSMNQKWNYLKAIKSSLIERKWNKV
ncbi:Putative teichuronic acid biosynthesis glycosyltransferase TuaH (fragment) [Candidatus Desulfarcum epimagneticum]|uniref:Teichuronic acid biosynthesis glycosyltransferase TuaH n=1 Tax=uncultured Desulfobacteraceae bacterium TaxID=218296 RepID=A0A484HH94_9BACT